MRYHRVHLGKEWLVKKSRSFMFCPSYFCISMAMTVVFLSLGAFILYSNWNKDVPFALIMFVPTLCLFGGVGAQAILIYSQASNRLVIYSDHVEVFRLCRCIQSIDVDDLENITVNSADHIIYFNVKKDVGLVRPLRVFKTRNFIAIDYSKRRVRLIVEQLGTDKIIISDTPSD